ncbi:MAG: SLBB domain-containing protein, partial [Armatimonadota bacterium]
VFFPVSGDQVSVSGQVARPAIYEILPGATVADALAMAGGLRDGAYARLLRLQRVEDGRRTARTLDARALLANPRHPDNLPLQDGDALAVEDVSALVRDKVTIRGWVEFPGEYSTRRTASVKALLGEAQLKTGAFLERADLLRALPDGTPVVVSIPLKSLLDGTAEDIPLLDQDEVVIYQSDEKALIPLVTIQGAVKHAASYRVTEGMRVSDLLFAAGGLQRDASTQTAHLYRRVGANDFKIIRLSPAGALAGTAADNPALRDEDRLIIYRQQEVEFKADKVSVVGEVQRPGEYRALQGLSLYDLVLQAGGPTDMAAGTVEVAVPLEQPDGARRADVKIYPLAEVLKAQAGNTPVTAGMLVSLPRRGDKLAQPWKVELKGQFRRPGTYALLYEGETLGSLIERAGGFADGSDPFGVSLTRQRDKMLSNATAEQIKTVTAAMDQLLPALKQTGTGQATGVEVLDVDSPTITPTTGSRSEKILLVSPRRLSRAPASSRISFTLEDQGSYIARVSKVALSDGDTIEVPRRSEVVQVLGAVQSPGPVFYQPGRTTTDYIDRAGGGAPDADLKRAVVIKVSGTVQPLSKVKSIEAGDVIIVASKYQVIQPPVRRTLSDILFDIFGVALIVRGLQ